jgi:hypothetical protein
VDKYNPVTANQKLLQAQQDLTLLRHEIAVALDLDFEKVVASTDLYKIYHPREIALKILLCLQQFLIGCLIGVLL